jgi:hypothetical protein
MQTRKTDVRKFIKRKNMRFSKHNEQISPGRRAVFAVSLILCLIMVICIKGQAVWAADALAGYGSQEEEQTEEDPNSWGNSKPAPFHIKIRFDEKFEELDEEDTKDWRRLTQAGYYIWDNDLVCAYLEGLKKKYDTEMGNVSFTTHKGVKMMISTPNCGWHMNIEMSRINLEDAADKGEEIVDPAWNSGCIYSSKNGIGKKYVEVSIDEQKVYLVENDEIIFESDCVTGTYGYTETTKGVFQVQSKASPTVLKDTDKNGNKYEQPVEYWIAFNGSQGMHDATWRGEFGGQIYKTWGSHGCVNLPLESAERIYKEVYVYYPVIVY